MRDQAFPHLTCPEDVADAILFLAGPRAAAISGANLVVDCAVLTGVQGALSHHEPS
jgi:NAD(P)-dependent dehydrogenase (short-subunit alcohol dehydrogenase family)